MANSDATREDIASEQAFFDKFYTDARVQDEASGWTIPPVWASKALNPTSRPLDNWEYSFYLLGDLQGKRVLDVGCGGGWISRLLALRGASVAAFDISIEGCRLTRDKLATAGFSARSIAVMDAHDLGFKDARFDALFMAGVLHHLNIAKVATEAHRVLKPGGRIVLYEPLQYGPIMWAIRQVWLRLNGLKEYGTTEHEEALKEQDLLPFSEIFAKTYVRKFNFIAKTNRLRNRFGALAVSLRAIDYVILSLFPFLQRYCTCIVCRFEK